MDEKVFDVLSAISERLDSMGKRFDSVDKRLDLMDKRFDSIEKRLDSMEKRLDDFDDHLRNVQIQQKEHTDILRALEHISEVHKAAIDDLAYKVSEIDKEAKGIRKDLANVEIITASNWSDIAKLKAVK